MATPEIKKVGDLLEQPEQGLAEDKPIPTDETKTGGWVSAG